MEGGAITNNDWYYFTTNEIIKSRIFKLTSGSILYRDTKQISLGPAYDSAKFWILHSHRFWSFLKQFVHDYKKKIDWLNRNSENLIF